MNSAAFIEVKDTSGKLYTLNLGFITCVIAHGEGSIVYLVEDNASITVVDSYERIVNEIHFVTGGYGLRRREDK